MSDATHYDEMKADREARKAAQNAEARDTAMSEIEKLRATLREILSVTERQRTPTFNAISELIDLALQGPTINPVIIGLRYNPDRQKYEPTEPAPASAPEGMKPTEGLRQLHQAYLDNQRAASAPSCCGADDEDDDCELCSGTGEVTIASAKVPDGDTFGCPVCIARELRATRARPCQCGELREATPESELAAKILAELTRARAKFPGKNVTFAALVEEVGELATATFEESAERVEKEAVQVAVMAMRMVLDGDHCFNEWREGKGLDPLDPVARAATAPCSGESHD